LREEGKLPIQDQKKKMKEKLNDSFLSPKQTKNFLKININCLADIWEQKE